MGKNNRPGNRVASRVLGLPGVANITAEVAREKAVEARQNLLMLDKGTESWGTGSPPARIEVSTRTGKYKNSAQIEFHHKAWVSIEYGHAFRRTRKGPVLAWVPGKHILGRLLNPSNVGSRTSYLKG